MSEHLPAEEQKRFLHAQLQQLQRAIPLFTPRQDTKSCWRCRNSHTKCDGDPTSDDPCRRCAASSGNKDIPCRRGLVCEPLTEIPFVCPLGQGQKWLLGSQDLPADHQDGARLLNDTRSRRVNDCDTASKVEMRNSHSALLWSVVNIKVPYINTGPPNGLEEMQLVGTLKLPYDEFIIKIVWELQDNPEAAEIMGIASVEHLVAFLEAASLCESQFGHHDHKRRLVFITMQLLLHCLQALRLSDPRSNLLGPNIHRFCAEANGCTCPGFHGVTRYAVRYAEGLTMAFFSKKKGDHNHWLPVIYSLRLQAHIRCVFMTLEARLRLVQDSFNNMGTPVHHPLYTAKYLYTAVALFEQIAIQGNGKLARKICDALAQVRPSVYLRAAYPNASDTNWQNWHPSDVGDIKKHAHTIFHQPQYISPHAVQVGVPGTGPNMAVTMATAFPVVDLTANAVSNEQSNDVNIGSDFCDRPQSVNSTFTATSFNTSAADGWSMDTISIAESVASNGTVVLDRTYSMPVDMGMNNNLVVNQHGGFNFGDDFSSGWPSHFTRPR